MYALLVRPVLLVRTFAKAVSRGGRRTTHRRVERAPCARTGAGRRRLRRHRPTRAGPFSGFTVVNSLGSKLDYYLDRSMTYQRNGCGRAVARWPRDLDQHRVARGCRRTSPHITTSLRRDYTPETTRSIINYSPRLDRR